MPASNVYLNVDICAAIVADKPPQLPLREELNSLGFEVVLAAAGTGVRASKYESKKALKRYRKNVATKDLKKTRLFPRSSRQIKRLLEERKKIEEELGLPHACSYETYHIKVKNGGESSENDRSVASFESGKKQKHRWGMFLRRRRSLSKKDDESDGSSDENRKFRRTAAQALFPDLSSEDSSDVSDDQSKLSSALSTQSNKSDSVLLRKHNEIPQSNDAAWKHVFDALYDSPSTHLKSVNATHQPNDPTGNNNTLLGLGDVPDVFGAFDGMDDDFSELLTKGEADHESMYSSIDQRAAARVGVDPDGINQISGQPFDETMQYSFSGEKVLESPSTKKVTFFDESDPYFREEKKDDDPLILAFGESEMYAPNLKNPSSSSLGNVSPFEDLTDMFYLTAGMDDSPKVSADVQESNLPPEVVSDTEDLDQDDNANKMDTVMDATQGQDESPTHTEPMSAFERATAEILRVAGIEPNKNQIAPNAEVPPSNEPKHDSDWITSAKTVFDNFSSGVLKVAGIDTNDANATSLNASNDKNTSPSRIVDITTLFASIVLFDVPSTEIEGILTDSPELAQVRRHKDGRLPLHELCDRGMPDRSGFPIATLTEYLLKDIASYKTLVYILVDCYPEGCTVQDRNLDLPVHLMARRLMEWEATWYEIVYQKAAKEKNADGATSVAITKLYHAMSESIDKLLQPLLENRDSSNTLCRATGSMGTILPLHIASIFTVSVRSLRLILEAYPEAAKIPCDLGILRTFIPDECLPLELHDNLSTDFPKWEIKAKDESGIDDSSGNDEDGIRRSDLLFAYNPIEPHRLEKPRIRRIESRLQYDALVLEGKTTKRLDDANERLWIWICTFQEPDSGRSTYVNSAKRIVSTLPIHSLRYLVSVKSESGEQLIDIATTECLKVIQMRLEQLHEVTPSLEQKQSSDSMLSLCDKEFVGHFCRLVFNVPTMPFPTSFIVLPYKLSQEADGTLHLSSTDSASLALQFAECLLNLTDPRSILFILDTKSKNHYDEQLYEALNSSDFLIQESERVNGFSDMLWSLYDSGDAYMYLIDESTGLPRIDSSSTVYPIVLSSPATLVQKLLPLMLMSMVQMRGDKAILKLAHVILDLNVAVIPPSWSSAADLLRNYLESSDCVNSEMKELVEALNEFLVTCPSKLRMNTRPRNGTTEWNSELSMLKMLLEINDPDKTYAGLTVPNRTEYVNFGFDDQGIHDDVGVNAQADERMPIIQTHVEPDVIDLSRKMDALSELQQRIHDDNGREFASQSPNPYDEEFSDDFMERKAIGEPYSLLIEDLTSLETEQVNEERDDSSPGTEIRIWNSVDRVWEDVTLQLNSRNEYLREDSQILHLKVALAEQAKKLSDLGKKVLQLKDEERRLASPNPGEIYDLTDVYDSGDTVASSRDSLSNARKLVTRMGDLEERIVCNEIKIQHLSMEAFSLEHDGDKMLEQMENPASEFNREISGISWGNSSSLANHQSQNSFLRYEKKVVRFNDLITEESIKSHDATEILVLDEYSEGGSWNPIIEIHESPPSTPSTYNSSRSRNAVDVSTVPLYTNLSKESISGRDPDGSYLGDDRLSVQAVSGTNNASDVRLPDRSLIDADSLCQTSEPSCSSVLMNVLSAPDASNVLGSDASKSRYQKLVAKKKRYDKVSSYQKNIDGFLPPMSPYADTDAGESTNDSSNERIFSAVDPYSTEPISIATAEAVFRPASSIVFPNTPHREISAMSSDKSQSSDLHSARKVLEIEQLITRYTSNVDVV